MSNAAEVLLVDAWDWHRMKQDTGTRSMPKVSRLVIVSLSVVHHTGTGPLLLVLWA